MGALTGCTAGPTPFAASGDASSPYSLQPAHEPGTVTTDALLYVLEQLPPNEVACTARLLCKETARGLSAPQHRTVRLSQPIPPHAVSWRCGEEALRQLSFGGKLGALSTAAASGCEANLEVVWRLVGPSFFPHLTHTCGPHEYWLHFPEPGKAAVWGGHAHLLPWLVEHGCPLDPVRTLHAVAERCDLVALQQAWALLGVEGGGVKTRIASAAAGSHTSDALSKLQWLVELQGCEVDTSVAAAAAGAGNLGCLRWLQQRGCDVASPVVRSAALRRASLEAVRTLWGQHALGSLAHGEEADAVIAAATSGVDAVAKLAWLQQEAGLELAGEVGQEALPFAARYGRLEAVRYLVEERGVAVSGARGEDGWELAEAAAMSCDRGVLQYLTQRGVEKHPEAYTRAAKQGDLGLVRWLVREGFSCSRGQVACSLVSNWPLRGAPGCGERVEEDCLAAVQAVVAAGAALGDDVVGAAAQRGSLPLVRWLVEEAGCVLPPGALRHGVQGGSAELLEWLVARGCCTTAHPGEEYVWPALNGDRATLALLRQLGVPWGPGALPVLHLSRLTPPVLQWFADHGMAPDAVEACRAVEQLGACNAAWGKSPGAREWLVGYLAQGQPGAAA